MDLGLREIQNAHPRNSSTCPLTTLSKTQYVKELVEILTPQYKRRDKFVAVVDFYLICVTGIKERLIDNYE